MESSSRSYVLNAWMVSKSLRASPLGRSILCASRRSNSARGQWTPTKNISRPLNKFTKSSFHSLVSRICSIIKLLPLLTYAASDKWKALKNFSRSSAQVKVVFVSEYCSQQVCLFGIDLWRLSTRLVRDNLSRVGWLSGTMLELFYAPKTVSAMDFKIVSLFWGFCSW